MKLSDFTIQERNVALDGQPERMGEWKAASGGALIATGLLRGKRYQLKVRASRPKWNNTGDVIKRKESELRSCDASMRPHLESEIDTLKKRRSNDDAEDRVNDEFLVAKKAIFDRINGIGKPELFSCSPEIWKEEIPFKGNGVFCVEAAPWLEQEMSYDEFARLGRNEQYDLLSTLAQNLATLHKAGIVHGDMKIGNTIIVKSEGRLQIAIIDYDCAFILDDLKNKKYSQATWSKIVGGTYVPPDYNMFKAYVYDGDEDDFNSDEADELRSQLSEKIDIFALGFTIWEYIFGATCTGAHQIPFVGPGGEAFDGSVEEYPLAIDAGYTLKLPEKEGTSGIDDLLYGILNWTLQADPAKRPDAATVAKVFSSRNDSLIPGEYKRVDLSVLPPEADIELVPTAGKKVYWIPDPATGAYTGKNFRVVKASGMALNYSKSRLLEEGLAKPKDGVTIAMPSSATSSADSDKPWPSDNMPGVTLPACVRRKPGADGAYIFTDTGRFRRTMTMAELKAAGFFCSAEEERTFWPDDVKRNPGVVMKPDQVAFRLMNEGPGNYLVQPKRFVDQGKSRTFGSKRATFDQLISGNYASVGYGSGGAPGISSATSSASYGASSGASGAGGAITRGSATFTALRPEEHIAYQLDQIPANVCMINKHPVGVHKYCITYDTGAREIVTVDELVAKGFVKRV